MTTPMSAEKTMVRVTVYAGDATIDLSLPAHVQISSLAPQVARAAVDKLKSLDLDTEWLEHPSSEILLDSHLGPTWDPTSNLDSNGVKDGDYILLTVKDSNERYPELVEVMQDATAIERNARFREWDLQTGYVFASYAFPILMSVIALSAAAAAFSYEHAPLRWATIGLASIIAITCMALSFGAKQWATRDDRVGQSLAMASYVPFAVAAALIVPGEVSRWSVLAGSTTVLVIALVYILANRAPIPAHYAVMVPALSTMAGIVIALGIGLWRDVPTATIAAISATCAILAFHYEDTLSRMGARLELPYLPSHTAEGNDIATANVLEVSRTLNEDSSWDSMINQRERNISARYNGLGIIIGVFVSIMGAAFVASKTVLPGQVQYLLPQYDARSVMLFHFAVICAIFVLKGSWYRDRTLRATAMLGGILSWSAYVIAMAVIAPVEFASPTRTAIALGVFFLISLISCAMAWRARPIRSARVRKWAERAETLLYLFPIINIVVLLNLIFFIRHR